MIKLAPLVSSALLLLPPIAAAQTAEPRVTAVFPVVKSGKVSGQVVRAINSVVVAVEGGTVLSGRDLRKKLRKQPQAAAKKCGSDAACFAALGKKAGATDILLARAKSGDGGSVFVSVERISVASGEVVRSAELTVKSAAEVTSDLGSMVASIMREAPGAVAKTEPATDQPPPADSTKPDPVADTATATATAKVEPTPAEPTGKQAANNVVETVVATDTAGVQPATEPETETAAPADGSPESGEPSVAVSQPRAPSTTYSPGVLMWAGLGGVVVGGALAGVGFYFGSQARDLRNLDPSTSQLEVVEQQEDQNRKATMANWMVGSGSVLLVAGLTAVTLDVLLGRRSAVAVNVTDDGASVGMAFSW